MADPPGGPTGPLSPGAPRDPAGPGNPGDPCGPERPVAPVAPGGPGGPEINKDNIIGSDRRHETKQGIEGKIVRFRSGRVRVSDKDRRFEPDRRSEAINFGACRLLNSDRRCEPNK